MSPSALPSTWRSRTCVVLIAMSALISACASDERPRLVPGEAEVVVNTAPKQALDPDASVGRQAGEPAIGRTAALPGDPLPPVFHVLGSVRSVADETDRFSGQALPILDDLATIASLGCTPSECPSGPLATWAEGQIEIINVATREAASEGAGQLGAQVSDLRARGITVVGFGENAIDAATPVIFTNGAEEIAIHAISLDPDNPAAATEDTPGVSGLADFDLLRQSVIANRNDDRGVIVLVDWGNTEGRAPTAEQVADVELIVEAGADAIIGHGSDFLQRFDLVGQAAVSYSLGNASVTTPEPLRADTAILRLEFDTPGRSCLFPATAGPNGPVLDNQENGRCSQTG